MLIDACVVIDFLRGEEKARVFFEKTRGMKMLVINLMEVMVGLQGKDNKKKLDRFMISVGMETAWVDESISRTALEVLVNYRQKLGIDIADAFLAAAALALGEEIYTFNLRHFEGIGRIKVRKPY